MKIVRERKVSDQYIDCDHCRDRADWRIDYDNHTHEHCCNSCYPEEQLKCDIPDISYE